MLEGYLPAPSDSTGLYGCLVEDGAGAIAIRTSKEEHRPIPIPQISDRHEELKPLYPLPYEKASSAEL